MLDVYVFGNIPHNYLLILKVKRLIFRNFKKKQVTGVTFLDFSPSLPFPSLSVSSLQQPEYFVHLHLPLFI